MAVLILAALALLSTASTATGRKTTPLNPGLQIRVTQRGVHKAAVVAVDLISSRLQNAPLPDYSHADGSFRLWLTRLRATLFRKPTTDVTVSPNLGITWNARNAALRVNGNVRYRKRVLFVPISGSGTFVATASGISFTVSFTLGTSASGQPTVRSTQCVVGIAGLNIDISGSLFSYVYNLLLSVYNNRIKNFIKTKICDIARKAIDGDLNDELSDVKVMSTIANNFQLDYRLIRVPQFSAGHFDSYHKGEFRSKVRPVTFASTPARFPIRTIASRMVNIWGSDYVINSFAFAAFKRGFLQHQISNSEVLSGALRVSCEGDTICLGRLFPELKNRYPNGEGELYVNATSAPNVHTTPGAISLLLAGEIGLQIQKPDGQVDSILALSVTLNMSVNVYLDGNVLKASVTSFCPIVNVMETTINNIQPNTLQGLFEVFLKKAVVESLNEIGLKGIDIPHMKKTRFTNVMVVKNQGSLMLAADVVWAPNSPNTPVKPSPPDSFNTTDSTNTTSQPLVACYNPDLLMDGGSLPQHGSHHSSAPLYRGTWVVLWLCAEIVML